MFFRNAKPKIESFEERIAGLKELGFAAKMQSPGRCLVTRDGCGAIAEDLGDGNMGIAIGKAGVLVGGEVAMLVRRIRLGKSESAGAPEKRANRRAGFAADWPAPDA